MSIELIYIFFFYLNIIRPDPLILLLISNYSHLFEDIK
jgi:hypothetical protein